MPRTGRPTENVTWEYDFPFPQLDVQGDFRTQPVGRFSRLTGIDGRFAGRLKRFPGFTTITPDLALPSPLIDHTFATPQTITLDSINGISLMQPFAIQRSPQSNDIIRGVLFLGNAPGFQSSSQNKVINGDFALDLSWWDFIQRVSHTTDGGGRARYTPNSTFNTGDLAKLGGGLVDTGEKFQLTFSVPRFDEGTAGQETSRIDVFAGGQKITTVRGAGNYFFTRVEQAPGILLFRFTGDTIVDLDNITLVIQNPAVAADRLYAWASIPGVIPANPEGGAAGDPGLYTVASWKNKLTDLSIATDHQLIYIVGSEEGDDGAAAPKTKIEKLARYTGITRGFVSVDWETKQPRQGQLVMAISPEDKVGGTLKIGSLVGFSYRYLYPDQGYIGPLSRPQVESIEDPGGGAGAFAWGVLVVDRPPLEHGEIFTRCICQVFRTVEQDFSGGSVGSLFLEAEWEVVRESRSVSDPELTVADADIGRFEDSGLALVGDDVITPLFSVGQAIYFTSSFIPRKKTSGSTVFGSIVRVVQRREVTKVDVNSSPKRLEWNRPISLVTVTSGFTDGEPGFSKDVFISQSSSRDEDDTGGRFIFPGRSGIFPVGFIPQLRSFEVNAPGMLVGGKEDSTFPTGLPSEALPLQPRLKPEEFAVFPGGNPRTTDITLYEDLFVRITQASQQDADGGIDVLRWEEIDRPRKGLVPILNRRTLNDLSDEVLGMRRAGGSLAILLNNSILRVHRSGSRLSIDTINNRHGVVASAGSVSIGNNLYLVSPVGVLIVDVVSGQLNVLNATQRFFDSTDRWRSDLASVQGAYDAKAGAIFFLNPVKYEMLILWLNHGVLSHLIDCPFEKVFSMVNLRDGGIREAHFFNQAAGKWYTFNVDDAAVTKTTHGQGSTTANGAFSGGTATVPIDTGAGFSSAIVGHFIRVRQTDGSWSRARITAQTSQSVTLDAAVAGVGLRYAIAGIPMQVTMWPLAGNAEGVPGTTMLLDVFHKKIVTSMGAAMAGVGTIPSINPNGKVEYQLFERDESAAAASAEGVMSDMDNFVTYTSLRRNHAVLVPGVELWGSDMPAELLGIIVKGTISRSLKDRTLGISEVGGV